MVSYSAISKAPLQIVWEHFMYKIDNPQHLVPGVSDVLIKEKNDEYVIRQMEIQMPDKPKNTVLEKITAAPYHVKFEIIQHPTFTGHVDNIAEYISDNETKITYAMHWKNKLTGEIVTNETIIKEAVTKTINFIANHNSK
jgi:hypothetical protein